jgi:hypothetical protein
MPNAIIPEIILSDDNRRFFVTDPSGNFYFNKNEHPKFSLESQVTSLFNMTSLTLYIGFLIIYFVFYYGLGKMLGAAAAVDILKTRAINLSVLLVVILGSIYFYYSLPAINQKHFFTYLMVLFKEELNDPNMVGVMILFLIALYIFIWIMGFGKKPLALELIEYKSWVYLIILIFVMFFIYGLHIEIVDFIFQKCYMWWNDIKHGVMSRPVHAPAKVPVPAKAPAKAPAPATNIESNNVASTSVPDKEEVFNIANNLYTYDDAQAICKSFDARLATYDEVEESYEDGGEWCNYGWSADQMILFPTQKSTWKELQKDPKTKYNCGRPGVNGGTMPNPYVKFGVNCYGKKPDPNKLSKNMFDEMNKPLPGPVPDAPPAIDPAVEYWKSQQEALRINSFNKKEWSEFSNVQ